MPRLLLAVALLSVLAAGVVATQEQQEPDQKPAVTAKATAPAKTLSRDHLTLAEHLKDKKDALQVENARLQEHLATFNRELAEALVLFRKDLGAKSTDQFDLDTLTFTPAPPNTPPQGPRSRN